MVLAQNIQSALDLALGAGNTLVTPVSTALTNRLYDITFQGDLGAANVAQLAPINIALNGTAPNLVASTLSEGQGSTIETVTFQGTTGGSVAFSYNGVAATGSVAFVPGQSPTAAPGRNLA